MKRRVLIADDDTHLAGLVAEYLEAKGMDVTCVSNAVTASEALIDASFDICILDVKMPMKSGFELAREIREVDSTMPIVFLTGESRTEQRIEGLLIGADDYLTKPFSFKELFLRVEAILRRVEGPVKQASSEFSIGQFTFDVSSRTLLFQGEATRLSEIETRLLEAFCKAPEGRVTRNYLLKSIWKDEAQLKGRSLNVYITRIRKLLTPDPAIEIMNIHGEGYRMVTGG